MQTQTETVSLPYTEKDRVILEDLARKINLCAKDAAEASHEALQSAITAGGHLTKAQDKVLYGRWGAWLKQNFSFSQSTANGWMRLWEHRVELLDLMKSSKDQYMSVEQALKLVAGPKKPERTKLQMIKKRCRDVIREIYNQSPSEAKRSRPLLIDHIRDVGEYLKTHGKD